MKLYDMKTYAISAAIAALALAVLPSCSPKFFSMDVEMRYPSSSGLDLAGKSIAVAYLDDGTDKSVFDGGLAEGLAQRLEDEYFGGEQEIGIFRMEKRAGAEYGVRDTLVNLVMDTGRDVVLLIGETEFGEPEAGVNEPFAGTFSNADSAYVCTVKMPFRMTLYAYDSMDRRDEVLSLSGSGSSRTLVFNDGGADAKELSAGVWKFMGPAGVRAGQQASGSLLNVWRNESHAVIYYDMSSWEAPSEAAFNYEWKEAVDLWMQLLDTGNIQRRACAEYDIALGCYMLGQYSLAEKWLDRADADYIISLSGALRKRIEERMNQAAL